MNNQIENEFCMRQFKSAIVLLAVLMVFVIGWTGYHCTQSPHRDDFNMIAAKTPSGPSISVNDKMLHPYWGNCNKCHVTIDAGRKTAKMNVRPNISIKSPMPHKFMGNCLLCHTIIDGFQMANRHTKQRLVIAAAFKQLTAQSVGMKLQAVTADMMQQYGLVNKDGVLVLAVASNSAASFAGLKMGDEIIRVKSTRIETINDFEAIINSCEPGSSVKINIYRGKRRKNVYLKIPKTAAGNHLTFPSSPPPMSQNQIETLAEQLGVPKTQQAVTLALQKQKQGHLIAAQAPMSQNQIETLAEQLGVPKTQQAVTLALQKQKHSNLAAKPSYGKVVIASTGPGTGYQVSNQFGTSPYFVVFDPAVNSYSIVSNPNVNDVTGQDIQSGQYMVEIGAANVIAGNFSQNALKTLHTMRVNVYSGSTGSVHSVINAYMAGKMIPADTSPNSISIKTGNRHNTGRIHTNVNNIY